MTSPTASTAEPAFYVVGGAVRDALMGLPASDRDWVAVGTTPEALAAQGYKAVGKDFPVFLHPSTGEEVALARTERKSGRGYKGFTVFTSPEVTLQDDLVRRDLTINAIAQAEDGTLIDPYGGQRDIQNRVLRHVSAAFIEDPVRLLRLARFAARFPSFSIAPETQALLCSMVQSGELDDLVPERVWQELARGLMSQRPSRMLGVLRECGALQRLLPEVAALWGVPQPEQHHPEIDTGLHLELVLDRAAALHAQLPVRWACLVHDLGKARTAPALLPRHHGHEQVSAKLAATLAERLRVPNDCRELADVVAREHGNIHRSGSLNATAAVRLLERCDALRRPQRLTDVLLSCQCDAQGRTGLADKPYEPAQRLPPLLQAALAIDSASVAQAAAERGLKGPAIGQAVHAARVAAVATTLAGT
jgi:tRNA nucleotidyltransferase (CCA-adding enzyme)